MTDDARLYLITPAAFDPADFAEDLKAALDVGGVACVRLDLVAEEAAIRRAADALRPICAAAEVAIVIADHVRLVQEHGLDGVHLREGGGGVLRAARKALGEEAVVGAWAGASRHRGIVAGEAGADYVALGPIRTGALGFGEFAPDDLFSWWDEMIETPSVAEGGLTPEDARRLAPVADYFAPRSSVWTHPEGAADGVRAYVDALASFRRG